MESEIGTKPKWYQNGSEIGTKPKWYKLISNCDFFQSMYFLKCDFKSFEVYAAGGLRIYFALKKHQKSVEK